MCCLHTADPCIPTALRVNYTCGTNNAVLSWNDSLGRESFIARIQTQDQSDSCSSNQTRCTFSSVLCGRLYNVSVGAVAGQCNNTNVARTQMQTGKKMNDRTTHSYPSAPQHTFIGIRYLFNTCFSPFLFFFSSTMCSSERVCQLAVHKLHSICDLGTKSWQHSI